MAAPKKRRLPVRIDMTPMVDVAFLLLIFFMSTTVFKKPSEVEVETPFSHSAFTLPETGVITITVPKDNRIFMTLGVSTLDVQFGLAAIEGRAAHGVVFKPEDLPARINELQLARLVNRVVIKADADAEYGTIEQVMNVLQKNQLNILNLVTELEEEYGGAGAPTDGEAAPGATSAAVGG
ncbi:biopolymer transporter ExbD [candidate division KSB1 bacterium]|nr:biopolymer transporter ExbD [candidate division KSB1 bacterium]